MTKNMFILLAFVFAFASLSPVRAADNADAPLELYFFGSGTCGECMEIKATLLKPLENELGDRLKVQYFDTDLSDSLLLLIEHDRGITPDKASPQELFFPDTVLFGFESIMKNTRGLIVTYLCDPSLPRSITLGETDKSTDELRRERFNAFAFGAIALAAFADSVNPCAIATMIFLVSFLTTRKRKRSEILITGMAYTLAVFITYLLLGVGAFKAITSLSSYRVASEVLKWIAVAFAGTIGIICFVDAFRYKKTGDAKDIKLQLPSSVKKRIHNVITKNMTGSRLLIGAFVTGFLVTLLEAVCTGQVYLPTIMAMTKQSGDGNLQLTGWFYLIMYNVIFVLPLITVMIAAYYGMKWSTLSKMMQKHLTLMKILLGIAMVGLALYLADIRKLFETPHRVDPLCAEAFDARPAPAVSDDSHAGETDEPPPVTAPTVSE